MSTNVLDKTNTALFQKLKVNELKTQKCYKLTQMYF